MSELRTCIQIVLAYMKYQTICLTILKTFSQKFSILFHLLHPENLLQPMRNACTWASLTHHNMLYYLPGYILCPIASNYIILGLVA